MSCRDEDRSQGTQSSDDWEGEELVIPGQIVFGKSSKIGKVDGHAAEQTDDDIQGCESGIGRVHIGRSDLYMTCHERAAAFGDNHAPEEQGEKCRWYDDTLDQEQESEFLDGHQSQDGLEDPIDELGRYVLASLCRGAAAAWIDLQSKEDRQK